MNRTINLFTIGFTQKTAQKFFDDLQKAGVKRVIDTRLNNVSQLAGFSKKADLEYFLKVIGGIDYVHVLDLAPTQDILDEYKKKKVDWTIYEQKFRQLISSRRIETKVSPDVINNACLLCSEAKPHNCHRRLVAEYLKEKWGNVNICHL
ncbi:MAG: DUF488 family protein [Microcystis sp.]|jgi:uncharacterized protein (DUF488 family)|uniref:DUF488 domain-containing protein n=1 Tax=Microcystis flos-aquae Mf_QC_C_20070823_S10D TaxID=2486236 RepID=A0A552L6P8_9CHRO|nr:MULTISPECIES: DUF488 domain-containing protein [Microcystis]MCA2817405.1 DUF488 domain-containing protein [Microcystis sp. M085S1]MCA2856299.1 DUF488 domain-containing protein [Microcystis sp. M065S1]MCZ8058416.1 DUF488 domain-containing protein [Microcystis sp. LE19-12.2C]MDJ0552037.1 DUF488 domain-containing protein [Microcystis sp. M49637_WE12]TRT75804.1 MAG: DUF488 domain-containing protein [Microcystis flos-aquae Ma_QC_C_20070823_S18]TRT96387.1 MAG: DUF488 domain-containing protein [M